MKYRNVFPDPSIISSRSRQGFPWDLSRRREDLNLDLEEGRLTLDGNRNASTREEEGSEDEEASRTYYRRERSRGAFRRTFALPDDLDEENVSARLNDGVLTIEMIRRSPAKRSIEVEGPSVTASMESDTRESSEYIRDGEEEK